MVIEARNVVKHFGTRVAVAGIDLAVPPGICFGLLGPNGAGKTTTLRMVYGVTRPTAGSVRVFGIDVAVNPRAVRSRLGVTLQQNVLIEALSPVENLRVFGRYHRIPHDLLEERVEELLDFLELRSHAHVPVKQLSGGFQRRMAIALSLVNDPELLILDEPTTFLDPAAQIALLDIVRRLNHELGRTVVMVLHDLNLAARYADYLVVLKDGQVAAHGTPREVIITQPELAAAAFHGQAGTHISPE